MPDKSNEHEEADFELPYNELDTVRDETTSFIGQRIMFWAVRWTIGFLIIWAIVSYYPNLFWLWWAGIAVAALSLAILLVGEIWMKREIDKTEARVQDLKAEIAKASKEDQGDR